MLSGKSPAPACLDGVSFSAAPPSIPFSSCYASSSHWWRQVHHGRSVGPECGSLWCSHFLGAARGARRWSGHIQLKIASTLDNRLRTRFPEFGRRLTEAASFPPPTQRTPSLPPCVIHLYRSTRRPGDGTTRRRRAPGKSTRRLPRNRSVEVRQDRKSVV